MELNLAQKILIVIIVLTVPFAVIISYDPFADRLGICNEDICPSDIKLKAQKCFINIDTECRFVEGVETGIRITETETAWQVVADDLICQRVVDKFAEPIYGQEEKIVEFCNDMGIFEKSEWRMSILHADLISGGFINTSIFDRIA